MDLNAKTEPKSPSAPGVHADARADHADARADAHEDARGIALAIIVKLRKGAIMNNCAKLF